MQKFFLTVTALASFVQVSNGQPTQADTKPEFYRPQYHFTAPKGWINDPNGLLYANGEYHLFYQHNPFGNEWGHMSWGHAVSKDLLHWQHLPIALNQYINGKDSVMIFSGSAVVDTDNRSGLFVKGKTDGMVAIYTSHVNANNQELAQHQSLAYSADKGRTWLQYAKNPVLDLKTKGFRDPNVFWYAPQKKWVMAAVKAEEHRVAFYASTNLKDWTLLSHFGPAADTSRVWECPALLPVPILDEPGKSKWVLFISAGHPQKNYLGMQYFVGNFDGMTFTLDKETTRPIPPVVKNQYAGAVVDWGKDYYAAVPVSNRPAGQRKPIMIGWLNDWEYANKLPTTPFKGAMSLPREIALKRTSAGLQLIQQPAAGTVSLRGEKIPQQNLTLTSQSRLLKKGAANAYEIEVEIVPGSAQAVGLKLAKNGGEETVIRYTDGRLQLDRRKSGNVAFSDRFPSVEEAPVHPRNGMIKLHIFVDREVVEVYANEGERVITDLIFPKEATGNVELFAEGGSAEFKKITIWSLKPIREPYK